MEYRSPELLKVPSYDVVISLETDSYSILCKAKDGRLLTYIHESGFPPSDEMLFEDKRVDSKILRVNSPVTLVPASEFSIDLIESIAREAFPFDEIRYCRHFSRDKVAGVYLLPVEVKKWIDLYFKDFLLEHTIMELIRKEQVHEPSLVVHWTKSGLILLGWKQGLQLAQYYRIEVPEDAIYYILSAYEHMGLDPHKDPLQMSGRILAESIYCDKLSGFVREFHWKKGPQPLPEGFVFQPHLLYHMTG